LQVPPSRKAEDRQQSAFSADYGAAVGRRLQSQDETKGSELRKIVAFSFIILAYLFIPIIILMIIIFCFETLGQIVAFASSNDAYDLESALLYLSITVILAYILRRLVRWARE
jgi:uncharacterized membrane protein